MDELREIIMHKLRFIQNYRNKKPISIQQKQKMVQLLLKQKRKQNSRDVIQSRLLQMVCTRRIQGPYHMEEFYNQSYQMMRIYSPTFQFISNDQKDPILNIVKLYVQFFTKNDSPRRAEQIQHIFNKKLCEKSMIIPTIFNWFVQWLRKIFKEFIKKTLNSLNLKNSLVQEEKNQRNKKFDEEISAHKASLSLIDQQIKQHKQKQLTLKLVGNRSKLLTPFLEIKTTREGPSSRINNRRNQSLLILKSKDSILTNLSIQDQSPSPNRNINFKQSIQIVKQVNQKVSLNLNRDIFYSAFFQQLAQYYKFYSVLGELDQNFPKGFRKIDRRQQINKNINVLVRSIARNQPNQIKNSIQNYCLKYSARNGKIVHSKQILKQKRLNKKRAQSVDINKKHARQFQPNKQYDGENQKGLQQKCGLSLTLKKQKSQTHRIEAQKKKIELQLPQIKQFKSMQKIIIANQGQIRLVNRYDKNKNQKQRVSAQLYKQLRQISSLFRSRRGIRKQELSDLSLVNEKISPISFKKENYQMSELLENSNGIFRLPKLHK